MHGALGALDHSRPDGVRYGVLEGIDVSDDLSSYPLWLRPGVTFTDGTPLTARDVLYSLNAPVTLGALPFLLTPAKNVDLAGVTVRDDLTLVLPTNRPIADGRPLPRSPPRSPAPHRPAADAGLEGRGVSHRGGAAGGLAPAAGLPGVADVRVRGAIGAIGVVQLDHLVDMAAATRVAVDAGVWLRPFRDLIYTMPPYVTGDADLDLICRAVRAASVA